MPAKVLHGAPKSRTEVVHNSDMKGHSDLKYETLC